MMRSTMAVALVLGPMSAWAQTPCPLQKEVEAIVSQHLPAFSLSMPARYEPDTCSNAVAGDFNGDGAPDLAAVLTEKVAPRTYKDGSPRFISYVVVLLRSELPYARHQAVLLPGHDSQNRIALKVVAAGAKGKPDQLAVEMTRYGRTVYEWTTAGFAVKDHVAD